QAEHDDRDGPERDEPGHRGVVVVAPEPVAPVRAVLAAQRPPPGGADPRDVAAEVQQHRGLGPDLGDRREGRPRVLRADELPHDAQVGARGDREELGQALDEAEQDGFPRVHERSRYPLGSHGPGPRRAGRAASGAAARAAPRGGRPAGEPRRVPTPRRAPRSPREAAPVPSAPMENRHLGSTGLRVSELGLGTMTWARATDELDAAEQLRDFVDAGGTLVDTAASYADGDAESLLGSLLGAKVDRRDVLLCTKAGVRHTAQGPVVDASRGALLASLGD